MNLEPRLRRTLRHEASQAETTLHPDDIVRRAQRRHRGIVGVSSAGTTVVLVLALIIGLPMLLAPQGPAKNSVPVGANSTPSSAQSARGKVALRFEVRVTTNPLKVRGTTRATATTFFAEILPVSKHERVGTESVPKPRPGVGYISEKLSDTDGDGIYHARIMLEPGRYLAAIFSGVGVRETPDGAYPGRPVELISQDSNDFRDGVIMLSGDRTISITYPAGTEAVESGADENEAGPPVALSGEFSLAAKEGSGSASSRYPATLSDVRVLHRPESDVVILEFEPDSGVPNYLIGYQRGPLRFEGSGRPADLVGGAAMRVLLTSAQIGSEFGVVLAEPDSGVVEQIKLLGSFEGHVKLGIGLSESARRQPFRVSIGPHSITIQIRSETG